MEYFSSNKFIPKLETQKYFIGSMDVFLDKVKETIKSYSKTLETIDYYSGEELLSLLPTAHRACIVSKETKGYVGFISTVDVDNKNNIASIHFEADIKLSNEDIDEIIDTYEEFLANSLNITKRKDLVILNKNAVVFEEGKFELKHKVIDEPHFEIRYKSRR